MSEMLTMSTKGQLVIPRRTREKLGLGPKTRIRMTVEGDKIILQKPQKSLWDLAGSIKGCGFSIEEEREAAMEAVSRHVLGEDEDDEN
jgi:looped-hinge helix DNA binding domain, AbrB family